MNRGKYGMILFITIVAWVSLVAFASFGQEKAKVQKEGYVGSGTCEGCHPEVYAAFKKNPTGGRNVKDAMVRAKSTPRPRGRGSSSPSRTRVRLLGPRFVSAAMKRSRTFSIWKKCPQAERRGMQ